MTPDQATELIQMIQVGFYLFAGFIGFMAA